MSENLLSVQILQCKKQIFSLIKDINKMHSSHKVDCLIIAIKSMIPLISWTVYEKINIIGSSDEMKQTRNNFDELLSKINEFLDSLGESDGSGESDSDAFSHDSGVVELVNKLTIKKSDENKNNQEFLVVDPDDESSIDSDNKDNESSD